MKDFFKQVCSTVVGIFLFTIVAGLLSLMILVGVVTSSSAKVSLPDDAVLSIKLSGPIQERRSSGLLSSLRDDDGFSLARTVQAIKLAENNDKIKGIYLNCGVTLGQLAQLQELRDALLHFKQSGKWIVAYGENYSQGSYYVASVANKLYMNPEGILDWQGLGVEAYFLRDVLAKVGVKMTALKVGKYKSATEMWTESQFSEPARQQMQRYLDGSWKTMVDAVSKSRRISIDSLNAYADRLVWSEQPAQLVRYRLFDALLYGEQVRAEVKKMLRIDEDQQIAQVTPTDVVDAQPSKEGDLIAVYYMDGDIQNDEMGQSSLDDEQHIVAAKVVPDLERLTKDDDVKAVVLRINSPGGSAYASEQIWHALQLLKKEKPVVVSMSGVCASGGYYIASAADYIVAQPTTLTGSIGIFGLIPDASVLLTQKIGIKFDEVMTNRNANLGSVGHAMTQEQQSAIQRRINQGYETFKSRVMLGRKMSAQEVEDRAQGHVYLAEDAIKLRLVDALGGLNVAVEKAANLAKLKKYTTNNYPKLRSFYDSLLDGDILSSSNNLDEQLRLVLGQAYAPVRTMIEAQRYDRIQARLPFVLTYN